MWWLIVLTIGVVAYIGARLIQVWHDSYAIGPLKLAMYCLFWPFTLIYLFCLAAAMGWAQTAEDFRLF